jgi:transposase
VLANSSLARRGTSNSWLRTLLVEAAHAASHTKNTYFSTQYHRLAARRGKKKAMISILVIVNHMLQQQKAYEELGGNSFNERQRQTTEKRLVRRLEQLGYEVSLKSAHPAA